MFFSVKTPRGAKVADKIKMLMMESDLLFQMSISKPKKEGTDRGLMSMVVRKI